jgi:CheY-like chemotaxis protein
MPEGGLLRFETAIVNVFEHDETSKLALAPGQYLLIRVSDTGCGIPQEIRSRVFEPFFTTKPIGEGTGMGLAAVYGTAMEHHGNVSILESSGRGTCFQMLLPLAEEGDTNSLPPSAKPLKITSGKVLLVDDEAIVRKTAGELMRTLGYEVHDFGDPRAAIDHFECQARDYDLVVLDMVMPGINGEEVFRMLRTIRGDIPVVLCSGYALDEAVVRLRREGLAGHLKKPFRREELREVLRGALEIARSA